MGGGPDKRQTQAADSQAALNDELTKILGSQEALKESGQRAANTVFGQMALRGDPYFQNKTDAASGTTAAAFAPARAQLERSLGQNANSLPSGFATGARTDLSALQGRAFDSQLQGAMDSNQATKERGAAGLLGQAQVANPTSYASIASSGNSSIMGAPLAKPGLGGLLGGLAGGLASAIPF